MLDVLVRASPAQSDEAVLETLDEALAAQIIEEVTPGLYQFTHALVRVTLYDELHTGQRRRLHHAVGEAIESLHRRDQRPVLAELAHHFHAASLGGDVSRAIEYAIRAGRNADEALAFEDAVTLFQNALEMLDTKKLDDPCDAAPCCFDWASAAKSNDYSTALKTLRAAVDVARMHDMLVTEAEIALVYAETAWDTI